MIFHNVTYDVDYPVSKQVNVPTNTDYKVGLKVKRNGKVQQLGPDEFTIYTGETAKEPDDIVGPADISSLQKSITVAYPDMFGTQFAGTVYDGSDLTAYYGKEVPASGCKLEYSVDNGATWTEFYMPSALGTAAFATNRNYPGNDGEETWFLEEGGKWKVKDGGVDKGYVESFVLPEAGAKHGGKYSFLVKTYQDRDSTPLSSIFGGHVPSVSNPVLTRATITFNGEEIPVTIPTDAEKTNGYVTITKASGDEATFKQYGVHINKGYDYNDYTERLTGQFGSTAPDPNPSILKVKASDLGLTGYTVKAEEYKNVHSYSWRNKSTPVPADLSAWNYMQYIWPQTVPYPPEQPWPQFKFTQWDGRDVYIGCPVNDVTFNNEWDDPGIKGRTAKKGVYYFFITNEEGTKYVDFYTERTFKADDYVIVGNGLRYTANYYYGRCYEMTFGTPFSADFKLNINEFKSQCGDINAQTDPDFNTAKVEGTYADGTEFSYDVLVK